MRTIERKQIALTLTAAHPHNREFPTRGQAWDEFEDDIAARGIQEDLVVRLKAGAEKQKYEVLRGHRRRHAGLRRKIKEAWCVVVDCSDEEAFEHMWEGNLFREDVSPADEALAVRVMLDVFGKTVKELAEKWHRSVEWIEDRQGMLELGEEVLAAVRLPGRERLTMGAVKEILKVPAELREQAVQLVLHPELELGTLDEAQARDVLRRCLLEPKAREAAWEGQRKRLGQVWRKTLEKLCLKGTKGDLMIQTKGLLEAQGMVRGFVEAETAVPLANVLPDAPTGLLWLHLAVKHGLAVAIVPGEGGGESRAIVNQRMITDAEAAVAEHGTGGNWLVVGKRKIVESGELRVEGEEKRVAKAKADLEAGFDTGVDTEEKPEVVIEQGFQHLAMIDFHRVKHLAMWAVSTNSDPQRAPDWVPKWAQELAMEGQWTVIDAVTAWVLSLKK